MRERRELMLILAMVLVLAAGCGEAGDEPAGAGGGLETTDQQAAETPETTEQVTEAAGEPGRESTGEPRQEAAEEPEREGATLRVEGEPGMPFSGTCTADGVGEDLEGETPETFTYEADQTLECEIRNQDPDAGSLRTVFTSADGTTRSTQQASGAESTISFTYSGGSFSSSISSSTGS